jgi:hypothetical protein
MNSSSFLINHHLGHHRAARRRIANASHTRARPDAASHTAAGTQHIYPSPGIALPLMLRPVYRAARTNSTPADTDPEAVKDGIDMCSQLGLDPDNVGVGTSVRRGVTHQSVRLVDQRLARRHRHPVSYRLFG